jgi:methionine-rich copper-binding protein CopC
MKTRTAITTIALAAAGAILLSAVAAAHVDIEKTNPRRGGTAKTSLRAVTITFDGPLRKGTVRVTGPGGTEVSLGRGGRDPRNINRLIGELKSSKSPGRYRVKWTLVAADGHKQRGSFRFRLKR